MTGPHAIMRRTRAAFGRAAPPAEALAANIPMFARIKEYAHRVVHDQRAGSRATALRSAIEKADEVWMNGEGDLILAPRRTLLRTLVIMRVARLLGRRVRLLNSILSRPPVGIANETVINVLREELVACASITYRDPMSLRLHERLFPDVTASWAPDALFLWAPDGADIVRTSIERLCYGPFAEGVKPELQQFLLTGRPYVVLSGSSSISSRGDSVAQGRESLLQLIGGLRRQQLEPVVVATCARDDWMLTVARALGCAAVPSATTLAAGLMLFSRARCIVSGRYHPSILGAVVGSPLVLMASNSHKTLSLQEVLGEPQPSEFPFLSQSAFKVTPVLDAIARSCERADSDRRLARLERSATLSTAVTRVPSTWS